MVANIDSIGLVVQMYPKTRQQRCWVHKTANVLNNLPNGVQTKAKSALQQIWMAEDLKQAEKAVRHFVQTYEAKYPKAARCVTKDQERLLAFYDFPAEHWVQCACGWQFSTGSIRSYQRRST